MSTLKRVGCAAFVAAFGLVPVLGSPVQADRGTVGDNFGDSSVYVSPTTEGRQATPAPEETLTDIRGSEFDYRRQKLVVTMKVAETTQDLFRPTRILVRVKDKDRDLVFSSYLGEVLRVDRLTDKGRKGAGKCKGGRATTNFDRDTITARIPVACFGGGDRVRVGAMLARVYSPDDFDTQYYYADDALNTAPIRSFDRFFTPRLAAGFDRG